MQRKNKVRYDLLTILVSLVVITVLLCTMFHVTHTYADSLPVVYDKAYYCHLATIEPVMGATQEELIDYSNSL